MTSLEDDLSSFTILDAACAELKDMTNYHTVVVIGCAIDPDTSNSPRIVLHWDTAENKIKNSGHVCPGSDMTTTRAEFKQLDEYHLVYSNEDGDDDNAGVYEYNLVTGFTLLGDLSGQHATGGLAVTNRGYPDCVSCSAN